MSRLLPSIFGGSEPRMGDLFREVERVFDDFSRRWPTTSESLSLPSGVLRPRIDVSETPDAVEVTAELPGVDEQDIEVTLADRMLQIKGQKKLEREQKEKDWHVQERSVGSFARAIALPFDPPKDAIDATFEKGVLHIRLPKPKDAAAATTRIEVKAGG